MKHEKKLCIIPFPAFAYALGLVSLCKLCSLCNAVVKVSSFQVRGVEIGSCSGEVLVVYITMPIFKKQNEKSC